MKRRQGLRAERRNGACPDGARRTRPPRALALLATANGWPVAPYVIAKLRRAANLWNEGEKALAQSTACRRSPPFSRSGHAAPSVQKYSRPCATVTRTTEGPAKDECGKPLPIYGYSFGALTRGQARNRSFSLRIHAGSTYPKLFPNDIMFYT
ncbi:MAG: hypothetical protein DLM68_07995 [Hyphomicrobiales bacterium]|nr:MAG: hypothetical protein DLM68_07995 [Hyphomicrobiales bacterium]